MNSFQGSRIDIIYHQFGLEFTSLILCIDTFSSWVPPPYWMRKNKYSVSSLQIKTNYIMKNCTNFSSNAGFKTNKLNIKHDALFMQQPQLNYAGCHNWVESTLNIERNWYMIPAEFMNPKRFRIQFSSSVCLDKLYTIIDLLENVPTFCKSVSVSRHSNPIFLICWLNNKWRKIDFRHFSQFVLLKKLQINSVENELNDSFRNCSFITAVIVAK